MPEYLLTQERKYYEREDLWNRPIDPANRNRIAATLRLVPDDAETLLDLGCGQGAVTNHLSPRVKTTAFDLSAEALGKVDPQAARVQGSGLQLPFRDKSFDLVLASEVIEHFPDAQQDAILAEIVRVAKKYILIGVPAEEDIAGATVVCTQCCTPYHVNHHYRSYSAPLMKGLVGWPLVKLGACGGSRALVQPALRKLGRAVGGTFESPHAMCPRCAARHPVAPRALPSLALKAANLVWRRLTGKDALRSHWIALYAAAGGTPSYARAEAMAAAAAARMQAAQTIFSFGRGLVAADAAAHVIEIASPGWNVLAWPRSLMAAMRSRANWFVAGDLPGRLLARLAARVRGGTVKPAGAAPLSREDFA